MKRPGAGFCAGLLAIGLLTASATGQEALQIEMIVNDALVKDKAVAGVQISAALDAESEPEPLGVTGGDGRLTASLPPGMWFITYQKSGYVVIFDSATEIRGDGQVITTSLSPMLESEGIGAEQMRIRVVLNWGSESDQVRDADSHIVCSCRTDGPHVFYQTKEHSGDSMHATNLDVDDTDWGGPETVTLIDPLPGRYPYWVHNYSGESTFGTSDIVVRVFIGDWMEAELKPPLELDGRNWRPFKNLVIDDDGSAWLEQFTPEELAAGADREDDPDYRSPEGQSDNDDGCAILAGILITFFLFGIVALVAIKLSRS